MAKTKVENKEMEVKEAATQEVAEKTTEANAVAKKFADFKAFLEQEKVNGFQFLEVNETNKIFRSNLLIEGQTLPMFVVINDSVYTFIQVHLVTLTPEKKAKCMEFLNEMNERFSMLKYFVNHEGNLVLTCSVPSGNDKFDPALIVALIDQVRLHLLENYPQLMKKIWEG